MQLAGGGPAASMRLGGSLGSSGTVRVTLPERTVLEGQWQEVGADTDLEAVYVEAVGGVVTAGSLAGPERPALTATLSGERLKMICVFIGDDSAGYLATCADSDNNRWIAKRRTSRR